MTLFDSYSWLCRRTDQKLLKYVCCSSFKWKQLLILSYLLKRTLVLLKVLPLSCIFAYTNLITHEFLYSSSSLLNEYLWYDKLWGPSQRVVTLLITITNLAASSWFPLSPSNNRNFPSLFQILAMHRNLHTSGFSILTKKQISHFQVWKPPLKKLNSSSISFSSWLLIGQTTATADCLSNQHSIILKVMLKKTWS